jgi:hypothetical protein
MGGSGMYSYIKDRVPTCGFRTTHLGSGNPIITMIKPAEPLVRKHAT